MKRNLFIISISLLFIYLIFTNTSLVSSSILTSCNLFLTKVFISLFPMYILSKILINYNLPYYLTKLFKNSYIYILLISILSGTPNNAVIIKDLLDKKQITIKDANKYIMCNFFINPLFLITMLQTIIPIKQALILILISYSTNIIIYLIQKPTHHTNLEKVKEIPFNELLIKETNNATNIFLCILEMIIIFNLISIYIPKALNPFIGILEVTNGLNYLAKTPYPLYITSILILIYLNFGGLSIYMQIKSILNKTNISDTNYLYGRFYAIIISIILYLFITLFI
ncbi:MAG: hypothetical protein PUD34_01340 [bacterium]|nr:hypothetical protein [bacterium]